MEGPLHLFPHNMKHALLWSKTWLPTPDGLFASVLEKILLWQQFWHANRQVATGGAGYPAPFKRHAAEVLTQNHSGDILFRKGWIPRAF